MTAGPPKQGSMGSHNAEQELGKLDLLVANINAWETGKSVLARFKAMEEAHHKQLEKQTHPFDVDIELVENDAVIEKSMTFKEKRDAEKAARARA